MSLDIGSTAKAQEAANEHGGSIPTKHSARATGVSQSAPTKGAKAAAHIPTGINHN